MHVKKTLIIALAILFTMTACNRNKLVKKLTGTWSLSRYLYGGQDETTQVRDTTMNNFKVSFSGNQSYIETWRALSFSSYNLILSDTLSYDTALSMYLIKYDTIPKIDTSITPYVATGRWDLINSEEDLQLTADSNGTITQYQILNLTGSELNLRSGSVEMYLNK